MTASSQEASAASILEFIVESEKRYEQITYWGKYLMSMGLAEAPHLETGITEIATQRMSDTVIVNSMLAQLGGIPVTLTGDHPDLPMVLTEWNGPVPNDEENHVWIGHTVLTGPAAGPPNFGQVELSPVAILADYTARQQPLQ